MPSSSPLSRKLRNVRLAPPGCVPKEGETIAKRLISTSRGDYLIDSATGCWIWQKYLDPKGYPVQSGGKAHKLYWERANGRVLPKGTHVHHTCRTPACVNPAHLEALEPHEHFEHHGREKHVLTPEEGAQVRELAKDPAWTLGAIAERFGVSYMHVCDLAMGNRWAGDYKGGPPAKPERDCAYCGEPIPVTKRRHAKFCTDDCRHRAKRAKTWTPNPARWTKPGRPPKALS